MLPIISSGHFVLGESVRDMQTDVLAFNIAVHVGTLLSILLVYHGDVWKVAQHRRVIAAIIVATLPIVIVGLLFKDTLEHACASPLAAGCAVCVTQGLV